MENKERWEAFRFRRNSISNLWISTTNMHQRFRGSQPPALGQALYAFEEEVREVLDEIAEGKNLVPENLAEELCDTIVTTLGVAYAQGVKFRLVQEALSEGWIVIESIRNGMGVAKSAVQESFNQFTSKLMSEIEAYPAEEVIKVVRHMIILCFTVGCAYGVTPEQIFEAMDKVALKNNAKDQTTHFLDIRTGKISRLAAKENPSEDA